MIRAIGLAVLLAISLRAQSVLVVTAHDEDYVLCAAGTVAAKIARGATVHVVHVTSGNVAESAQAAGILGIKDSLDLGYRSGELGAVSPTELRDRLIFLIRHYKPATLFLPNPYAHHDSELDHYYAGSAAEEAAWASGLDNFAPVHAEIGLAPHRVPELYYYSLPFDPETQVAEAGARFVPQPHAIDIAASLDRKVRALEALRTYNRAVAVDVAARLQRTGRHLPEIDRLPQIRVKAMGTKERFLVTAPPSAPAAGARAPAP